MLGKVRRSTVNAADEMNDGGVRIGFLSAGVMLRDELNTAAHHFGLRKPARPCNPVEKAAGFFIESDADGHIQIVVQTSYKCNTNV